MMTLVHINAPVSIIHSKIGVQCQLVAVPVQKIYVVLELKMISCFYTAQRIHFLGNHVVDFYSFTINFSLNFICIWRNEWESAWLAVEDFITQILHACYLCLLGHFRDISLVANLENLNGGHLGTLGETFADWPITTTPAAGEVYAWGSWEGNGKSF